MLVTFLLAFLPSPRLDQKITDFSICFYQYHGGTNFGRTSGGPFIATSYDYDAPIDEYGKLVIHNLLVL